jgi:hypothetical protein
MTGKRKLTAKDLLLAYLEANGIETSRSKVGLNFRYEGWNFLLWHDADEPLFFRLTLPGIFDVTDENYAQALMACNMINWNYRVVKASLYEFNEDDRQRASVWVCYEQWLDGNNLSTDLVVRAINALMEAAERFQSLTERGVV